MLFYRPDDGWTGDFIPFHDGQQYQLFYLKTRRHGEAFSDIVWHKVSTYDFVRFDNDCPINIAGGTGSVLHVNGLYHLFYCDNSNPTQQFVCHATSKDLLNWHQLSEETFGSDDCIYEKVNWRDPHVFWNEEAQEYYMLLATRTKGPTNRCGCTGLCTSKDLHHWTYREPFYAPRIDVGAHECPDIFQIGEWWYLVYSSYTGFYATIYRMSRSINGPWIIPKIETLDGRAFYAGKTASHNGETYIFGWNPTREAQYYQNWNPKDYSGLDYNVFDWAGNLVVHQLMQNEDGTLRVVLPSSLSELFTKPQTLCRSPLLGEWKIESDLACSSSEGFNMLDIGPLPNQCKITFTLTFGEDTHRCGIGLHADKHADQAYYFTFDRQYQRIKYQSYIMETDEGWRRFPWMTELEQPLEIFVGKTYSITILVDESICEVYINDQVALSARMYDRRGGNIVLYSLGKGSTFTAVACYTSK
jgi:beta-fructofuranosidase